MWPIDPAEDAVWPKASRRHVRDGLDGVRLLEPLSASYCYSRLRTYGGRCGIKVTPHRLRHSCATLLLNAGAPVAMVQAILGHRHIDTTLRYARLYDSTVAKDYFLAMGTIEGSLDLEESSEEQPPIGGQLLALVDTLRTGTLNEDQKQTVLALRTGILAFVTQDAEEV